MTLIVLPHTIDAGTEAVANELQLNFETIRDTVNGQLSENNILASAGISPSKLKGLGAPVTSLPGSPNDGDLVVFAGDASNGVEWLLRYNAGSGSAYKWEFLGGGAMYFMVSTDESTASASYVDLTTVGPSLTVPLAGDYRIQGGCSTWRSTAGAAQSLMSLKVGAAATSDSDKIVWFASAADAGATQKSITGQRELRKLGLTAGTVLKMQYKSTSGTAQFLDRWMAIQPVKVG